LLKRMRLSRPKTILKDASNRLLARAARLMHHAFSIAYGTAGRAATVRERLPQTLFQSSLNLKLAAAFLFALGALVAQDVTTAYMNPNVLRVGEKLSCRCGGCRNTVGSCPMLHCEFSDPMRHRIASMQSKGQSDQQIVDTIVREQGIEALSAPAGQGWGLFTWIMPAVAALIGFLIYSFYVKRHQQQTPAALTPVDQEVLQRFHEQIDRELDDDPEAPTKHLDQEK